jgi:hypothetical protein
MPEHNAQGQSKQKEGTNHQFPLFGILGRTTARPFQDFMIHFRFDRVQKRHSGNRAAPAENIDWR